MPVPTDELLDTTAGIVSNLAGVHDVLTDPERSSVRLVTTAERVVVSESRRAHTYLALFGYRVDAVIANRLLPEEIDDPWFDSWRKLQAEQLEEIALGFAPVPILHVPLASAEPIGGVELAKLATALYGEDDPSGRLHTAEPLCINREDRRWVLELDLHGVESDVVDAGRRGSELIVTVGPYRRAIVLPDSLHGAEVSGASLEDGRLIVTFEAP